MLVDDEDLAVADDIVLVPFEELLGLDRVVDVADERRVEGLVEVVDSQKVLDLVDAGLQDADRALLLVHLVVGLLAHVHGEPGEFEVPLVGVAVRGAGDDQRGTGFVDEDRVDLVDDHEVVAPLDAVARLPGHVVAQVVEAEFVVRPVGDVGLVFFAAFVGGLAGEDAAGGQAEESVDATHELGLVFGQVVVDRHDVHAFAGERVEIGGQRRDEGLALSRLHLGDVAEVEGGASHDLHVVGALPDGAPGGFAHGREGLGEQVVEALAVGQALLELVRLRAQFLIRHILERRLQGVDLFGDHLEFLESSPLTGAEDLIEQFSHEGFS